MRDPKPMKVDPPEGYVPTEGDVGPLYTLAEAATFLGRDLRLVQRWVKKDLLVSRHRQTQWPYAQLVTWQDLEGVAKIRRTRKTPKPAPARSGKDFELRPTPINKEA